MSKKTGPRILLFDIETMAGLGWFWQRRETNILSVKHDWYIISFAYKWLGEKRTYVHALPDFPLYKQDKRNDKDLCKKLWEVLNGADIVIAHYGDAFDLKKSNARFICHGFDPVPPIKSVDTYKVSRRHFKFGSNKLDDVAKYFNLGAKHQTGGWQLWLDCAENDIKSAWNKMKKYNKQDVILLEKVYLKLRPYMNNHPNIGVLNGEGVCPKCGSRNIQYRGYAITSTCKYRRFQCLECSGWGKESTSIKQDKTLRNT